MQPSPLLSFLSPYVGLRSLNFDAPAVAKLVKDKILVADELIRRFGLFYDPLLARNLTHAPLNRDLAARVELIWARCEECRLQGGKALTTRLENISAISGKTPDDVTDAYFAILKYLPMVAEEMEAAFLASHNLWLPLLEQRFQSMRSNLLSEVNEATLLLFTLTDNDPPPLQDADATKLEKLLLSRAALPFAPKKFRSFFDLLAEWKVYLDFQNASPEGEDHPKRSLCHLQQLCSVTHLSYEFLCERARLLKEDGQVQPVDSPYPPKLSLRSYVARKSFEVFCHRLNLQMSECAPMLCQFESNEEMRRAFVFFSYSEELQKLSPYVKMGTSYFNTCIHFCTLSRHILRSFSSTVSVEIRPLFGDSPQTFTQPDILKTLSFLFMGFLQADADALTQFFLSYKDLSGEAVIQAAEEIKKMPPSPQDRLIKLRWLLVNISTLHRLRVFNFAPALEIQIHPSLVLEWILAAEESYQNAFFVQLSDGIHEEAERALKNLGQLCGTLPHSAPLGTESLSLFPEKMLSVLTFLLKNAAQFNGELSYIDGLRLENDENKGLKFLFFENIDSDLQIQHFLSCKKIFSYFRGCMPKSPSTSSMFEAILAAEERDHSLFSSLLEATDYDTLVQALIFLPLLTLPRNDNLRAFNCLLANFSFFLGTFKLLEKLSPSDHLKSVQASFITSYFKETQSAQLALTQTVLAEHLLLLQTFVKDFSFPRESTLIDLCFHPDLKNKARSFESCLKCFPRIYRIRDFYDTWLEFIRERLTLVHIDFVRKLLVELQLEETLYNIFFILNHLPLGAEIFTQDTIRLPPASIAFLKTPLARRLSVEQTVDCFFVFLDFEWSVSQRKLEELELIEKVVGNALTGREILDWLANRTTHNDCRELLNSLARCQAILQDGLDAPSISLEIYKDISHIINSLRKSLNSSLPVLPAFLQGILLFFTDPTAALLTLTTSPDFGQFFSFQSLSASSYLQQPLAPSCPEGKTLYAYWFWPQDERKAPLLTLSLFHFTSLQNHSISYPLRLPASFLRDNPSILSFIHLLIQDIGTDGKMVSGLFRSDLPYLSQEAQDSWASIQLKGTFQEKTKEDIGHILHHFVLQIRRFFRKGLFYLWQASDKRIFFLEDLPFDSRVEKQNFMIDGEKGLLTIKITPQENSHLLSTQFSFQSETVTIPMLYPNAMFPKENHEDLKQLILWQLKLLTLLNKNL